MMSIAVVAILFSCRRRSDSAATLDQSKPEREPHQPLEQEEGETGDSDALQNLRHWRFLTEVVAVRSANTCLKYKTIVAAVNRSADKLCGSFFRTLVRRNAKGYTGPLRGVGSRRAGKRYRVTKERVTSHYTATRQVAGRAAIRPALAVALLLIFASAMVLFYLWARSHDFRTATRLAEEMLSEPQTADEIAQALARWEEQTGSAWRDNEAGFIEYLLANHAQDSPAARRVLAYVSGADFGDRAEDWKRWDAARRKLAAGGQPQSSAREAISLGERWSASVGLTSWYSTILPIDGRIFVASQGQALGDDRDEADGVVLVDGTTGQSALIFESPDKPPRDVVGLIAADGSLVVACRNGFLYGIEPDGKLRWRAHCGAKIVSPPLGFDANGKGAIGIAVVTEAGRVVAIAPGGRTLWVTPIDLPARPKLSLDLFPLEERGVMRAVLAYGPLPPTGSSGVLVTTWHGLVMALNPTSGKPVWNLRLPNGVVGGPLLLPTDDGAEPGAYVGDVTGRVWSLLRADRRTTATAVWTVGQRHCADLLPALRSTVDSSGATALLACATDGLERVPQAPRSELCLLTADGIRWRCPIDGVVRAAPAVADFNGDNGPETLVVSTLPAAGGTAQTLLTFVSAEGLVLRRYSIDAAVYASPVVADVDGDGHLDVLVADRTGLLHRYTTDKFGVVHWGLAGGDPRGAHNAADAFTFSQTPKGYQAKWRPGGAKKR
jgi:outer membrane protein assembly factor BamB